MTDRSIILRDHEVRAFLAGRKSQIRRPVKWPVAGPWIGSKRAVFGPADVGGERLLRACPFGVPGSELWARECFALGRAFNASRIGELPIIERDIAVWWRADGIEDESWANRGKWRSASTMPKWASRLSLRVTDVRVERVQSISEDDARAEGVWPLCGGYVGQEPHKDGLRKEWRTTARGAFHDTWNADYAAKGLGWDANPWVWALTVEVVR